MLARAVADQTNLRGRNSRLSCRARSPSAVKVLVQIGHRFPLHTAAPGKALLAVLPESERGDLVRSLEYTRFNRRTIVGPAAMHAELARVRELGYAVDRGEELEDIRCVAAAVLDHRGYPLAAIWIGGPASRLADSALAAPARSASIKASESAAFGARSSPSRIWSACWSTTRSSSPSSPSGTPPTKPAANSSAAVDSPLAVGVADAAVRLEVYKATPAFQARERRGEWPITVLRQDTPDYEFGNDYGEFFDGLDPAAAQPGQAG